MLSRTLTTKESYQIVNCRRKDESPGRTGDDRAPGTRTPIALDLTASPEVSNPDELTDSAEWHRASRDEWSDSPPIGRMSPP
jgi:hypothetical protein